MRRLIRWNSVLTLVVPYPTSRDEALALARRIELKLGLRVEPILRSIRARVRCHDLRVHGPLRPSDLRLARTVILAARPNSPRAPASE